MRPCTFVLASLVCCLLISRTYAESPDSRDGHSARQKMLLRLHETGALRDIEPRALKTIAGLVANALINAGYEVQDAGVLNGEMRNLQRDTMTDNAALAGFSHLLEVSIEAARQQQSPVGFSLSIGDSDPRSPEFQKAMVTPIHCTLVQLDARREQGSLIQDKQIPRSTSSERWSDAKERAYARNILSVCHSLLAELEIPRNLAHSEESEAGLGVRIETTYVDEEPKGVGGARTAPVAKAGLEAGEEAAESELAPSATRSIKRQTASPAATPEPKSEQEAGILSAVKVERSSKRKQITIFNQGDTLILEIGNNRR
ncbi:MAG: hypothetical protein ACREX9_00500 [Gammaproteobacteria bacterium]